MVMRNINKLEKYCDIFYKIAKGNKSNKKSSKKSNEKKVAPIASKKLVDKTKLTTPTEKSPEDTFQSQKGFYRELGSKIQSKRAPLLWRSGSKGEIKEVAPYVTDAGDNTKISIDGGFFSASGSGTPIHCLLVWFRDPQNLRQSDLPENKVEWFSNPDIRESVVHRVLRSIGQDPNLFYIKDKERSSGISFFAGEHAPNYTNPVFVIKKDFHPSEMSDKLK